MGESVGVAERTRVRSSKTHQRDGTGVGSSRRARLVSIAFGAAAMSAIVAGSLPVPATLTIVAMVPAAMIDAGERRLPNELVAAATIVLAVAVSISWALGGSVRPASMAVGAGAMAAPILLVHLWSPRSMGFGDVKAALVLGAAVGSVAWQLGLLALCVAAGIGAGVGLARRARTIAFGPYLVAGAGVAVIGSELGLGNLLSGPGS